MTESTYTFGRLGSAQIRCAYDFSFIFLFFCAKSQITNLLSVVCETEYLVRVTSDCELYVLCDSDECE